QPDTLVAELGPYFERGETPCYGCFYSATVNGKAASNHKSHDRQFARMSNRLWANMLAVETVYLLSRIGPAVTGHGMARYNLQDWTAQTLKCAKVPGCPQCLPLDKKLPTPEQLLQSATALAYESAVRFPSRHLLNLKSHQVHYKT